VRLRDASANVRLRDASSFVAARRPNEIPDSSNRSFVTRRADALRDPDWKFLLKAFGLVVAISFCLTFFAALAGK
jgi:hypothetical protein